MTEKDTNKETRIKSMILSILFHSVLLLFFFLVSFSHPKTPAPLVLDEGIEVNLGNSDIGFGDIQPMVPGEPSNEMSDDNPVNSEASQSDNRASETSENSDADEIHSQESQNNRTTTNTQNTNNNNRNTNTTTTNESQNRRRGRTYQGGNGDGGNNSDEFNNSRNHGNAGGNGDQGVPNGDPNSDNFNGNGGNGKGGATVTRGNRKIVKANSFRHDLPKATIYADISVDEDGRGSFINFAASPASTSYESKYKSAIKNYLPEIEFDKTGKKETVTVKFVFDVKN